MIRDRVLRIAAIGLMLYGLFGFALLAFGFVVATQTLEQVEATRAAIVGQRDALVGSLRSTSQALGQAADTFGTFETTLGQTQRSTQQAAALSREASRTSSELAVATQVQIFNFQPLAGLGPGFERVSQQLDQLGGNLDATGESLGKNIGGVGQTGANLGEVRRRVDLLAQSFEETPLLGGSADALGVFRLAIYGLLLWLGGQALVSVLIGIGLYSHANTRIRASRVAQAAAVAAAQAATTGEPVPAGQGERP